MGEWEKSAELFEKAKQRYILEPAMEYDWAQDYMMAGNYTKAIESFIAVLGNSSDNPAQIFYQIGYAYMQLNDLIKARSYFEQSLSSKSDNPPARGFLAYIYAQNGDMANARLLWRQNIQDDANNPVLYTNMGISFEQEQKYAEALDYYTKARTLTPDNPGLLINIGNVQAALGNAGEAFNDYAAALRSPLREKAAYDIFVLAQKKADTVRSQEMLVLLTKEFPLSVLSLRAQADANLRTGDTLKAQKLYEAIAVKDTNDWFALARIYINYSEYTKAEACISHLPDDPTWQKAAVELAARKAYDNKDYTQAFYLFSSLNDTSAAMQYNLAVIAFDAHDYTTVLLLCDSLAARTDMSNRIDICRIASNAAIALKQWNAALRWSSELASLKPDDAVVQYNCAVAYYNLDFMSSAWTYYQKAKALNPALSNNDIENRHTSLESPAIKITSVANDSLDIWYNDAVTQQEQHNDSAAEVLYKHILERDTAYARALNNLGAIYSARGQLSEAADCFLKLLDKRHDMPEAYANLVNVYLAQDSIAEARHWIFKGLGHNPDSRLLKDLDMKVKNAQKTNDTLNNVTASRKHGSKKVR